MGPLIGLSGRQALGYRFEGVPPVLADAPFDLHWSEYAEKVAAADGLPVQLPLAVDPAAVVERLDGLLLSGGTDIAPDRFGATPGPNLWSVEPDRDAFEFALLDAAVDRGIPVLGICRGTQVINVHFGGTLVADLPSDSSDAHPSMAFPRHIARHEITVEAGSVVSDLYGPSAVVNSFHHQSVDRVGKGLRVTARSADGVVEAIEHDVHTIVGVQWHPEMMRIQEPIWDWFIKTCS